MTTRPKIRERVDGIRKEYTVSELFFEAHPNANRNHARRGVVCPYCSDTSGSAVVDEDGFRCFQCGTSYIGVINFWMHEYSVDFYTATEDLWQRMGGQPYIIRESVADKSKPLRESKATKDIKFSMDDIFGYYRNIEMALPYFRKRGISDLTAHSRRLGYSLAESTKPYEDRDKKLYWLKAPRYTIPYIYGDTVQTINTRLDEEWALNQYHNGEQAELLHKLEEDFIIQKKIERAQFDLMQFLRKCYGPKYYNKGLAHIFNLERIQPLNGENPKVDYAVIVEGEFDNIAVEEDGFPSVAAKHYSAGLIEAVSKLSRVIVIQDNDPDRLDLQTGLMVNDARKNAEAIVSKINQVFPHRAMRITPPNGFKDADDLHVAGKLVSWLYQAANITPVLNTGSRKRTRSVL